LAGVEDLKRVFVDVWNLPNYFNVAMLLWSYRIISVYTFLAVVKLRLQNMIFVKFFPRNTAVL
jgi:hypothetical protein